MEIFIDGGLFELLAAISLGYIINIIFLKKYLLILFSAVSVSATILTIFFNKGDIFYFLAAINIFNSILLVVLLWRQRSKYPNQPLFDIGKIKKVFYSRFLKKKQIKKWCCKIKLRTTFVPAGFSQHTLKFKNLLRKPPLNHTLKRKKTPTLKFKKRRVLLS